MFSDNLFIALVIAAIIALAFFLEARTKWASKVGATLIVIALGALVSNLGWVPEKAPIYSTIFGPVTSLAIVWLLFAVDLTDLKKAGPTMLKAFLLAILGTALGAFVGALVFQNAFPQHFWKLAGTLTGTYAGGSLNFVAVGQALELPAELFAATSAADNVVTALWFGATLLIPAWFMKRQGSGSKNTAKSATQPPVVNPLQANVPMKLFDLSALIALGLGLIWFSQFFAATLQSWGFPDIPVVVFLSTFALIVGHLPFVRRLQGAFILGYFAMHIFFVVIGIYSKFSAIMAVGLEVFYFTLLVVLIHGVFIYLISIWLRMDKATSSVASQAAIGGPSTALAIAVSLKRGDLALPGLVVGMLGYGVGTYLGLAIAYACRALMM